MNQGGNSIYVAAMDLLERKVPKYQKEGRW